MVLLSYKVCYILRSVAKSRQSSMVTSQDLTCLFHMSTLDVSPLGCLIGWYMVVPFYIMLSRMEPPDDSTRFFYSGVDIGDEYLIPGYTWMFSLFSGQ